MDAFIVPPWLGGLLIGWFVILHFIIVGRSAGCSTGYACAVDLLHKDDDSRFGELDPLKLFFILGLPIGGLIYAVFFTGSWQLSFDMGIYDSVLPKSDVMKTLILLIGGTFLGFGARMAGGCTTGHALVGGAILNWVSILTAVLFFIFATATTWLLFYFWG